MDRGFFFVSVLEIFFLSVPLLEEVKELWTRGQNYFLFSPSRTGFPRIFASTPSDRHKKWRFYDDGGFQLRR